MAGRPGRLRPNAIRPLIVAGCRTIIAAAGQSPLGATLFRPAIAAAAQRVIQCDPAPDLHVSLRRSARDSGRLQLAVVPIRPHGRRACGTPRRTTCPTRGPGGRTSARSPARAAARPAPAPLDRSARRRLLSGEGAAPRTATPNCATIAAGLRLFRARRRTRSPSRFTTAGPTPRANGQGVPRLQRDRPRTTGAPRLPPSGQGCTRARGSRGR
jgi:hypothetical protein